MTTFKDHVEILDDLPVPPNKPHLDEIFCEHANSKICVASCLVRRQGLYPSSADRAGVCCDPKCYVHSMIRRDSDFEEVMYEQYVAYMAWSEKWEKWLRKSTRVVGPDIAKEMRSFIRSIEDQAASMGD